MLNLHYMKKFIHVLSIGMLFTGCALIKNNKTTFKEEEQTGLKQALEQDFEATKDRSLGIVPTERLWQAKKYKDELVTKKTRAALTNVNWVELGPNNQAGRTRTVKIDLSDPTGNTAWVGSVGGGLWKTTNMLSTSPSWSTNTGLLSNISIADITQNPNNLLELYFGTGEAISSTSSVRGNGVFKSIDGGITWNQLPSTNNNSFRNSTRLIMTNNGNLLVGTSFDGVQLSTDGGATFTKVLGTGLSITGANSNFCYDVELSASGEIYANINGSIHKSIDDGLSFGPALTLPIVAERMEIACAPSNENVLYIVAEKASKVEGILKSTDAGTSWTIKTEPADSDPGIPATDFSRGQAWYDLSIAVHPKDENLLFVGGVDLFRSKDGGNNWQQISHWYGGFSFQYVHADQHSIIFNPFNDNIAYVTHDGGVDELSNADGATPVFNYLGENYNTLQFYACAMHPTNTYYLAGSQDNGTIRLTSNLLGSGKQATGGDGAFCHIDQDEPDYQFTSYVYNNYRRSTDGGLTYSQINYNDAGQFINPTDYDNTNNIMYCTSNANKYLVWTDPQTGNNFIENTISNFNGSRANAITVSPNVSNRVYFGTENGYVVRVDNANSATPTNQIIGTNTTLQNAEVSCIIVEEGNEAHILVTYSNYGATHIYETINGGGTWTNVQGNFPDIPVRWALFNPNNTDQAIIATELGVWSTDNLDGAATIWGPNNSSLANVRTDMLQIRSSDKMVIAATHGRGLFRSDIFADPKAGFEQSSTVGYIGEPINFTNTSIKSSVNNWDFGDGTTSTAISPAKAFANPGVYSVSLEINNGIDKVIKNNLITILPNYSAPYTKAQGGDFETNTTDFKADNILGTPWELGKSTIVGKSNTTSGNNAYVTGLTAPLYAENTTAYLYTPQVQLAGSGTYTISFQAKYNLEPQYDGFLLEYTLDSGKTWQALGNVPQTNWYDYSNNPRVSLVFPLAQAFFNSNQNNFAKKQFDLTALAGNMVGFRFVFNTDEFSETAGIAIDDFEVLGPWGGPLNLELVNFIATNKGEEVALIWQIHNDLIGNDYELEKSTDAINFNVINKQYSSTNVYSNYNYTDKNAWATAQEDMWYRLKINKPNGSIYSQIQKVSKANINASVEITPNPFTDKIVVNATSKISQISLCQIDGKKINNIEVINNVISVPKELPSGIYILKLKVAGKFLERKVEKR